MNKDKITETIAQKNVLRFLAETGAKTTEEAVLAITKLMAVATESIATVADHETSIDILDGVKASAVFNQQAKTVTIQSDVVVTHSTPTTMQ